MRQAAFEGGVAGAVAALRRAEDVLLVSTLGLMVLLAPLQILLRNFFDAGIVWADPLLRVLVLWVGMLGAMSASREGRHITVDVFSRMLPGRAGAVVGIVVSVFASVVSGLVAWHAGRFVASEYEYASIAFAGVPAWMCEIVIPLAFGSIALRSLGGVALGLAALLGRRLEREERA